MYCTCVLSSELGSRRSSTRSGFTLSMLIAYSIGFDVTAYRCDGKSIFSIVKPYLHRLLSAGDAILIVFVHESSRDVATGHELAEASQRYAMLVENEKSTLFWKTFVYVHCFALIPSKTYQGGLTSMKIVTVSRVVPDSKCAQCTMTLNSKCGHLVDESN